MATRTIRRWTEAELAFLRTNIAGGHKFVAYNLGRTRRAVRAMAERLGLRTRSEYWTEEEDAWLRDNHGPLDLEQCAAKLGRTKKAVYLRLWKKLQLPMRPQWTYKALDWLRANYRKLGSKKCATYLAKSVTAVRCQAQRLGVARQRRWTAEEDAELREDYPTDGAKHLAEELGRSLLAIRRRAKRLGVRRNWSADVREAKKLYYRGWGDACIAKRLYRYKGWFAAWREGPAKRPCKCPACKRKRAGKAGPPRDGFNKNDLKEDFDG